MFDSKVNLHHNRAVNMAIAHTLPPNSGLFRDVAILVVDNDRDNRELHAFLLECYGAKVTTTDSIKAALELLNGYTPALLVCEIRFMGERVDPLLQRVKDLTRHTGRTIPIMVTSTCPLARLTQPLPVAVEAYLLKPIDLNYFVSKIWNLIYLSSITALPSIQDVANQNSDKSLPCLTGVS
ncbi:MAG: two-component system response regulator [Leptolyngbya sp. BL-A-14]